MTTTRPPMTGYPQSMSGQEKKKIGGKKRRVNGKNRKRTYGGYREEGKPASITKKNRADLR